VGCKVKTTLLVESRARVLEGRSRRFSPTLRVWIEGARSAFECLSRINALTLDRAKTARTPFLDGESREAGSRLISASRCDRARPLGSFEEMFGGVSQGRQTASLRRIGLREPGRFFETKRRTGISIASAEPNLLIARECCVIYITK
jgi:hypothetical protein